MLLIGHLPLWTSEYAREYSSGNELAREQVICAALCMSSAVFKAYEAFRFACSSCFVGKGSSVLLRCCLPFLCSGVTGTKLLKFSLYGKNWEWEEGQDKEHEHED